MSGQKNILESIVNDIYPAFEGMDSHFKNQDKEGFSLFCHSMLSGGISMTIRNKYKLWDKDSENHKYFKEVLKVEHPDDMSAKITEAIWDKYHKENN